MSTKIYTGFVLNTTDIFEINKKIVEFRKELKDITNNKIADYMATSCAHIYDTQVGNPSSLQRVVDNSIYSTVYRQYIKDQEKVRVERVSDPSVDYSFSITLFPFEGKFYGMTYTQQPEYQKLWNDKEYVDEFMYWDNTDQPDDISNSVWKRRGNVWEHILKDEVPALNGFTYEVVLDYTHVLPDISKVVNHIPDLHTRALSIAKDITFATFTKGEKMTGDNVMETFRNYSDYISTENGKDELKDVTDQLLTKLRLTIDVEQIGRTE